MSDAPSYDKLDDLPPATAPASYQVSVRGGFETEEQARTFGSQISAAIHLFSCYIDMERLDGVTVAADYDEALRQLDRGFQASQLLTRSNDGRVFGVAMSPAVKRDGIVKAHLVFATGAVVAIANAAGSDAMRDALYTIAHECGHVEDLKVRDRAFPGLLLSQRYASHDVQIYEQASDVMWEEYAACRASAPFARQKQISDYETGLQRMLDGARARSNAAIRDYRLSHDIQRVVAEVVQHSCEPLRMFAYLKGTLDGHGVTIEEAVPTSAKTIADSAYAALFERASDTLQMLWERRGSWASREEFNPLRRIVQEAIEDAGLVFTLKPDGGLRADLPFLPGTIPGDG